MAGDTVICAGCTEAALRLDPGEMQADDDQTLRLVLRPSRRSRSDMVYHWCMTRSRTNIEIENTYVEAIMDRYGARTKTEAVEFALRHLAGQPMTREQALEMRGAHALGEVVPDSPSATA